MNMNVWRVYNAVAEGETDHPDFDPDCPWYVALDIGFMTFELDVRFPSEEDARAFFREELVGAAIEGDQS